MILIASTLTIAEGAEESFLAACRAVVAATRQEPGVLGFSCLRELDSATEFVFLEEFEDSTALKAHAAAPHLQKFREATAALIESQTVRSHRVDKTYTL